MLPFTKALPLTDGGQRLERLTWQPPEVPDELNLFEIDARDGFDKPTRIVSTRIVRGLKGLEQQMRFSAVTPAQLLEGFRQEAIGDTWQTIENVQWRYDHKAQASILTISGTGITKWENDGDGARSLALPGGGFSPPERRARAADQDQSAPYYARPDYNCSVTTLRLPSTTQSKHWSSKDDFDTVIFGRRYRRVWELRDGTVRMIRASRVEQPEIDAGTAQRDNGRIASFDNSMGWVTYDPSAPQEPVGSGKKVPATFELDWTAADVSCLSSAKAGGNVASR